MDNKTKCLYVAIAILLASNGYLLYRLGESNVKKPELVTGYNKIPDGVKTIRLSDVREFVDDIYFGKDSKGENNKRQPHWLLYYGVDSVISVRDKKEIEKVNNYLGKKKK